MTQSLSIGNNLLAALPPQSLARMMPNLRPFSLSVRQVLLAPGQRIDAVYFIERGWVSMVAHLDEGAQAEVGLVGREGMIGAPLAAGVETEFAEIYVQAAGMALRMEAAAFERQLDEDPLLRPRVLRYNEALHAQTAQTAACNGRHPLEQRVVRWLLMAHDRGEGDQLPLTQEFLALMLCVYRPSVTVAARALQEAGLIRYAKGCITILDRGALEAAACNCYGAVSERFRQLLG